MSSPLLKPRWLIGHVLVLALTASFVLLGFWQLDRHGSQRQDNAVVEARLAAAPADLTRAYTTPQAFELQRASVTGRYDNAAQLELRPRVRNGQTGYDQVVPLNTADGVLLVNRGFVADAAGSARQVPLLEADLEVTGTIRLSQGTSRFGPQNPDTGILGTIVRIDIDRLNSQFQGALVPVYLDMISEEPDPGGLPTVVPALPQPTSQPHLLYALQWWAFAAIASVGWVAYLRKQFFAS